MEKIAFLSLVSRILASFCGLCLIALGVALMTRTNLGCTPISAIPYAVYLLASQISYGAWVAIFNFLLLIGETILMTAKLSWKSITIQVALVFSFGFFVDIFMALSDGVISDAYWNRVFWVAAGSLSLASGVVMTVGANLAILPADGLALAICDRFKKDFGRVRILGDLVMALTGLGICLLAFREPLATREGTILAAILTGALVKFLIALKHKLGALLSRKKSGRRNAANDGRAD